MLQRRLDLTNEQRTQVEVIIAKRQTELITIRRNFQPQIAGQLDQLRDEIDQVLTDPQCERWDQLFTTHVNRWLRLPRRDRKPRFQESLSWWRRQSLRPRRLFRNYIRSAS